MRGEHFLIRLPSVAKLRGIYNGVYKTHNIMPLSFYVTVLHAVLEISLVLTVFELSHLFVGEGGMETCSAKSGWCA